MSTNHFLSPPPLPSKRTKIQRKKNKKIEINDGEEERKREKERKRGIKCLPRKLRFKKNSGTLYIFYKVHGFL